MSTTYIAILVNIVAFVAPHFGYTLVDPNSLAGAIVDAVGVLATVWAFIGRWRAGGITILGLRRA